MSTRLQPRFQRPYTELVYQPMLELLDHLRANGFETHIVSGGGIAFMRPWTERVYGIPPQQVVGSQMALAYEVRDGRPVIVRQPKIAFIDDKAGKPVGIQRHIGRRPILAFGNSDGDYQMLEWTTAGPGRRLGLILHHDDAEREYAYDRDSHMGRLDQAPGLAWDSRPAEAGGQRWFHLYPDEPDMRPDHPLHWTAPDQTWNYQCAKCHSTSLDKGYDLATDSFRTTWAEVHVGCEACPGQAAGAAGAPGPAGGRAPASPEGPGCLSRRPAGQCRAARGASEHRAHGHGPG
ncbi:HAD family hydrolase [Halochromatium glycolicum]|uniref:HAD family hydrolase n=1 Tax=Halochromatium glycolicum TaxID=85075 RepID=UPI0030B84DD6